MPPPFGPRQLQCGSGIAAGRAVTCSESGVTAQRPLASSPLHLHARPRAVLIVTAGEAVGACSTLSALPDDTALLCFPRWQEGHWHGPVWRPSQRAVHPPPRSGGGEVPLLWLGSLCHEGDRSLNLSQQHFLTQKTVLRLSPGWLEHPLPGPLPGKGISRRGARCTLKEPGTQ